MRRTVAVVCPNWAVSGLDTAVVVHANRVVAASAGARSAGARKGMRRREVQSLIPDISIVAFDPAEQMRSFEPVIAAVEAFTPRVEVVEPGVCLFSAKGPARYFGGEEQLVWLIADAVDALPGRQQLHPTERCRVGIADTPHASRLAAWRNTVVPAGRTREFLAGWPLNALNDPPLESLLSRLGLSTLGDLAELPLKKVVARFGMAGYRAHNIASGVDERLLKPRDAPADLSVVWRCEPAIENVEQVTFAAKSAGDALLSRLSEVGLACTRVQILLETEHGEQSQRTWRSSGPMTPHDVAERTRWQLEGWILSGEISAGVTTVTLNPDEVTVGSQSGLWGRLGDVDVRVRRALERVQGLLGVDGVELAVVSGGRDPVEQTTWVGWGEPLEPAQAGLPGSVAVSGPVQVEMPPWPGRLPPPFPTQVEVEPVAVTVEDPSGGQLRISRRLSMSGEPFAVDGVRVTGWAGPWPSDTRWWDPAAASRRVKMQLTLANGTAVLVALDRGNWYREAVWD